ncbi:hypothetical protein PHPALM_29510 [Phytophthora palmivora]|uniref:Retrotransposon gag domain-containing protein n=1 Tax=Phytophthora palmivora TaxID=4796 RepID=A0A2P4X7F0_9STRA|nr:hypothetical protein PHPALM_29510 [Phytophthora palmivora]
MPSSGYVSTLFGPTASGSEESNLSGPVESQSSGKMSSSSSLWSMGGAASAHMPYSFVAPPGMGFVLKAALRKLTGILERRGTEATEFQAIHSIIQAIVLVEEVAKPVDQVGTDESLRKDESILHVQQAFHAIQALAVRGRPPEERRSPSVPGSVSRSDLSPRSPASVPAARTPASPQTVDAARAEGAHTALESARVEFEERWQQREAKAEAEKVAWVADVQKALSAQLEAFQQKIHSLEETRNRDHETNRDLKSVQEMRSRNTPAIHPQVQDTRATYGSDSATQVKSEPTRVTMYPLPGNAIKEHASERQDIKCESDLPAEQLRLTLQSLTGTKYAKEDETVKSEQTPGVKLSSVSRPKSQVRETKPVAPEKTDAKKPAKKDSNRKHSRQDGDPSGASSGGESSDEGYSSSDSSSSDEVPVYTTTVAITQGGSVEALRTFTVTLEDFDEKLSLSARRRWWERFLNVTVQRGWTDQMKVYELKTKMSPAVRNWYGQLSKHVRSEWSRLSKEFKREYCKSRVSETEKYYTMKQFKDETALTFLYHLNLAAERADVHFRKSERRREQHIKRFIKNLTDVTLKTTL